MKAGLVRRLLVVLSIAWIVIWIGASIFVGLFVLEDQTFYEAVAEGTGISKWLFFIIQALIMLTPLVIIWSLYAVGYWIGHESWPHYTEGGIGTLLGVLAVIGLYGGLFFLFDVLHPLYAQYIWLPTEAYWNFHDWHPWLQKIGNGIEFLTEFVLAFLVAFFVVGFIMLVLVRIYEEAFSRKTDHESD